MHQMGSEIYQGLEKPLIGFFPFFYSAGETIPLIKIAKSYMNLGGKVIFFSHGGTYEYLADDHDFKIVRLKKSSELVENKISLKELKQKVPVEKLMFKEFSKEFIQDLIDEEINAFSTTGIEGLVSSFNLSSSISARVSNKPLIVLTSGTSIPQYYKSGFVTYPDSYENFLTKLLPQFFKNNIARWFLLNNKTLVKDFNMMGKKYNLKPFRSLNDILLGDYTLICDDINFLGLKPTQEFPKENYVGPIISGDFFQEEHKKIDDDIKNHLKKPGRSILFTMGGMGLKNLSLKILETLNKTDYNIIASYTSVFKENELPKLNDNILLKKFIKNIKTLNQLVDLAIISGGRGTIYTAALSGKPVIGIPLHIEQQYYIEALVRYGMVIRLSKKYFTEEKLLLAINEIFKNYDKFLKNAQLLKNKLPVSKGEENAAQRILEIVTSEIKSNKYGKN
jgi:UDP-N-acetylglucosamine:LPS N-acetylglucosamine transferase